MAEREDIYRTTNSGKFIPVQEIVRCKDCRKRNKINECPIKMAISHITMDIELPNNIDPTKNGNWFCGDGKRTSDSC